MSNNISLGMLKILRPHPTRFCKRREIGERRHDNINNSSFEIISANTELLLEDMYHRNQELTFLLQKQIERNQKLLEDIKQQNSIAFDHTYNGEALDIIRLKMLEKDIRTKAQYYYGFYRPDCIENKVKNFADE
jgi:hypothetical protein